jgi:hypothetical protein
VGLAYSVHAAALFEITIPHPGSLTIGHSPPKVTSAGIVMRLALTTMTDTTRESSRRWMGFKSNTRATVTAGLGDEECAPAKRQLCCTQHCPAPGANAVPWAVAPRQRWAWPQARRAGQASLGLYQSESISLDLDHFKKFMPPLT